MKLKSFLLGSAAALVAFSGARAADAVIAEPEPVEFVRVCDAYGAGFFYIPGTETCLQLSGYVRYDVNVNEDGWEKDTTAAINFDARSDTDLGLLRGYIALRFGKSGEGDSLSINGLSYSSDLDEAFIQLGGLTIGTTYDYFDGIGIGGENDGLGGAQVNLIGYNYAANGFNVGVAVIDDNDNNAGVAADFTPNFSATVGYTAGAFEVDAVVAYDNDDPEDTYAAKIRANVDVTEGGTLGVAVVYSDGPTYTWNASEWSVAASYTQKFSDTISASLGVQYWSDINGTLVNGGVNGVYSNAEGYQVGANVDWTPVTNFLVRAQVSYFDFDGATAADADSDGFAGRLRFQRSF